MRHRVILIAVILLVSCPVSVRGDEFRIVPYVAAKEEYNTNILFSADGAAKRDFVTTLSPGIEISERTERFDIDLLSRLDRLDYAGNRGLSATNQSYNGRFRYLASPLTSISAEAGYMKNSNPTLDIGATGIVTAAVLWRRVTSSVSADYRLTERADVVTSYDYGRDYYEGSGLLDDVSHDVSAGLVYDLAEYLPRLKGRATAGYSYYHFPGFRTDTANGTVGFSWDLNETWSILADGGIRRTWSQEPTAQSGSGGWGWVENVSLNYKGERDGADLTYARDITPAYGLNGAAERNALTLSARDRFTEELSVVFTASYYTLKSVSALSTQNIYQRTVRVNPGVLYEFSKDTSVEASYEYDRVDYTGSDTGAARQIFFIRFNIRRPFLE